MRLMRANSVLRDKTFLIATVRCRSGSFCYTGGPDSTPFLMQRKKPGCPILLYWWARQYPVSDAEEEAGVSNRMAIDAYQWLRETCIHKLL